MTTELDAARQRVEVYRHSDNPLAPTAAWLLREVDRLTDNARVSLGDEYDEVIVDPVFSLGVLYRGLLAENERLREQLASRPELRPGEYGRIAARRYSDAAEQEWEKRLAGESAEGEKSCENS